MGRRFGIRRRSIRSSGSSNWRKAHGTSKSEAAQALGVSARMWRYCDAGTHLASKVVKLTAIGLTLGREQRDRFCSNCGTDSRSQQRVVAGDFAARGDLTELGCYFGAADRRRARNACGPRRRCQRRRRRAMLGPWRLDRGSGTGIASSKSLVQGCAGARQSASVGPVSHKRTRYVTATWLFPPVRPFAALRYFYACPQRRFDAIAAPSTMAPSFLKAISGSILP